MWPFKKKTKPVIQTMPPGQISYSQLDITENFNDNIRLKPEDWISTIPLNKTVPDAQAVGLPLVGASAEEVYKIASKLSRFREAAPIPNDGVYCPICHIANTELGKLRTPCPKCGRALLKFGGIDKGKAKRRPFGRR
jgi:hypothetical protein